MLVIIDPKDSGIIVYNKINKDCSFLALSDEDRFIYVPGYHRTIDPQLPRSRSPNDGLRPELVMPHKRYLEGFNLLLADKESSPDSSFIPVYFEKFFYGVFNVKIMFFYFIFNTFQKISLPVFLPHVPASENQSKTDHKYPRI